MPFRPDTSRVAAFAESARESVIIVGFIYKNIISFLGSLDAATVCSDDDDDNNQLQSSQVVGNAETSTFCFS